MSRMFASAAVVLAVGLGAPAMAQEAGQGSQDQTEVTVEQGAPEVQVRQPAPEVTVVDPEPEVQVETPQPDVAVQQPEPDVQVDQAEPQVTVEQEGQPDVTIRETDEARTGQPQEQPQEQEQAETPSAAPAGNEAWQEAIGNTVMSQDGEEIGEVSQVISGPDGDPLLIISRGGFLGLGQKEYALRPADVTIEGETVTVPLSASQIAEMPEYDAEAEGGGEQGQQQ